MFYFLFQFIYSEQDIKDAVITVPSFFNQAERRAVMTSAKMVGINVLQLMSDNAAGANNFFVFLFCFFLLYLLSFSLH